MCSGCIQWKFQSAETWGLRFADMVGNKLKPFKPKITDAAIWEPTNGLVVLDAVFPHISYKFRNKTLPIATFHVRISNSSCIENIYSFPRTFRNLKNPPWQIVTYSESGEVIGLNGIAVHILNELARKLNFT